MKPYILIIVLAMVCLWNRQASAFWGSDATDAASGLNVAAGFDINTLTTVAGKVTSLPERKGEEQHTVMTVAASQGAVTVVLGPWWYWEKQGITLAKHQEISVTGSLAQGKDGALYIFAQRLENRSTNETVTLRSETGKPLWSRGDAGSQGGNRKLDGIGPRSGSGSRGSGMRGGRR